MIGKKSVDELRQRVLDRHPEGVKDFYVSTEQFRANIVLDTAESFDEDNYFEMRVGPMLLRNSGPCIRCTTVALNLDKDVVP